MAEPDWEQLDQLVRAHMDEGMRLAVRLCGSIADAEDVLQDALLRVVRGYRGLRDAGSFRIWFLRIVVNAARDWRRQRQRRREQTGLDATVEAVVDHRAGASEPDLMTRVLMWIDQLPSRQREALILTRLVRLSAREAAEVMETSEQNVRVLVSLARAKLKARLREERLTDST